jgi:hypothetical protein
MSFLVVILDIIGAIFDIAELLYFGWEAYGKLSDEDLS